ncbi:LamG domain-containing protein [Planctomycetales bacterium ZRK34]|nr:LamG domain-containing protein [Planctomycetales bacterium ZRK34]
MTTFRILIAALAAGLLQAAVAQAAINPYATDGDTLHLWHFDEVSNPAADSAGSEDLTLSGSATFGATAVTGGFGTAMHVADFLSDDNGAYGSLGVSPTGFVTDAATGAFTMEAMIRPTIALGSITDNMQFISMEGAVQRSFQFRIKAGTGELDFINIGGGGSPAQVAIPTTGPDAYEVGAWYHVAVTYDGNEGSAGNFKFYWTKAEPGRTRANLLAERTMGNDLASTGNFVVGNENRAPSEDSFVGQIDETRISSAVREADQFIFSRNGTGPVLLADNFNTTDTADINADLGSRQTGLLAATTYSTLSDGAAIVNNQASFGATDSSTLSPNVNFADGAAGAAINSGGGFIIDFDVNPVSGSNDTGGDSDWFAVSFGHTSATPGGNPLITSGSADFGILFRDNGEFQMFDNGANVAPTASTFDANVFAGEVYNIRLVVDTDAAAAGTGGVRVFVNGVAIDLTNDITSLGYNFTWDAQGDNYIVFESRNEPAVFDNLLIAAIPTPAALPAGLMMFGLIALRRRAH